jgi:ABC-type antimicrobial peptide transport system permease subunit
MKISDLMKMGLRNLTRRKARTLLTVIGVIIGTLSIIVMVSIGTGMKSNYQSQVMQQGSLTMITVSTYADIWDDNGQWVDSKQQKLDEKLVEQIKVMEHVKAVSPVIQKGVTLYSGKYQGWAQIYAMDSSSFADFGFPELEMGEYPDEETNDTIIFGNQALYEFYYFSGRSQQTKTIDLAKDRLVLKFQEYPVNERKKEFSMELKNVAKMVATQNWEYDYSCYMDLDYFRSLYMKYCNTLSLEDRKKAISSIEEYQQIKLNVDSVDNVEEVQKKLTEMGYQSSSLISNYKPLMEAADTMQMVLGALGAVAMLVSAISIANTMVMSIYERTKEIGIMKVLGCAVKDVRKLFLFEAALIGLLGGCIGISFGYGASWLINKFGQPIFKALMSSNYMYDLQNTQFSIIPIWLPPVSVGIAIIIGVLSGYFPARRATKIRAIEAMKTEG